MSKLILAPDSFKGTLSAAEVCEIWQASAARHMPDAHCVSLPLSDGGEGLVGAVREGVGGEEITVTVSDPLGRDTRAAYLLLPDGEAVIEMAAASGLTLLSPDERDPARTTSYGTGELILDAIARGARHIILGLGGSATNDAGLGAASAMGLRIIKADGSVVGHDRTAFKHAAAVDASEYRQRIENVRFTLACDVNNPLCGPLGATAVFGPQKGATDKQIAALDNELLQLSALLAQDSGRDCANIPGCGAAGGFALPLLSYGDVTVSSGIDIVLDILGFDEELDGARLVITGEGRTDAQSAMGKVISGVAKRAGAKGVPVIVLSGALTGGSEALFDVGVTAMFAACTEPATLEQVLSGSRESLTRASDNLFRLLSVLL